MIRQALNTYVGATALTVDFVTKPRGFLKKAERKGNSLTIRAEKQLRSLGKQALGTVEDLASNPLSVLGVNQPRAAIRKATPKPVRRRVKRARRARATGRPARGTRRTRTTTKSATRTLTAVPASSSAAASN